MRFFFVIMLDKSALYMDIDIYEEMKVLQVFKSGECKNLSFAFLLTIVRATESGHYFPIVNVLILLLYTQLQNY
jgi:hypothetical protein